jgi:hypothetical protein
MFREVRSLQEDHDMSDLDKLWTLFHRYQPMFAEQYAEWQARQAEAPAQLPAGAAAEPGAEEAEQAEEAEPEHLTRPTDETRTTTRTTTTTRTR